MNNKTKLKIIFLIFLLILDIGYIPRFSGYNIANKIVVIITFILTFLIGYSFCRNSIIAKKKMVKKQAAIQELIRDIKGGSIPRIETHSLILKTKEYACSEIQTYLVEQKNKIVGTVGSNSGISVRVTRGVYLHSGTSGRKKRYKNITEQYLGNFIITNQRVVFINAQKGFEILYKNLTSVTSTNTNLILQSKSKSYSLVIKHSDLYEELIKIMISQQ